MSIFLFWDMTFGEVVDYLKAYNKRQENKLKEKALMDFKLACAITKGVSCLFDKNQNLSFDEIYKDIFIDEHEELEKTKIKAQVEINKQRMKDFANFHNKRREEGKE